MDQKLLAFNNALKSFGTDMKTQFNNICEEIVQLNGKNDQLQEKCNDLTQNQEQLNENQEILTSEVRESSTSQEILNKNMSILYQNITDVRKFQYDAQDEIKVIKNQIKNMTLTITQTSKGLDFTNKKLDSVAKDVQYLASGIVKTRAIPPRRQGAQGTIRDEFNFKTQILKEAFNSDTKTTESSQLQYSRAGGDTSEDNQIGMNRSKRRTVVIPEEIQLSYNATLSDITNAEKEIAKLEHSVVKAAKQKKRELRSKIRKARQYVDQLVDHKEELLLAHPSLESEMTKSRRCGREARRHS